MRYSNIWRQPNGDDGKSMKVQCTLYTVLHRCWLHLSLCGGFLYLKKIYLTYFYAVLRYIRIIEFDYFFNVQNSMFYLLAFVVGVWVCLNLFFFICLTILETITSSMSLSQCYKADPFCLPNKISTPILCACGRNISINSSILCKRKIRIKSIEVEFLEICPFFANLPS